MNRTVAHAIGRVMLFAAAFGVLGTGAYAQDPTGNDDAARDGGGIVVEAPRIIPPPPVPRSQYSGAPVATTTIRISARYFDLDLTRPRDADRLMTRITNVARDACRYLDGLYPLSPDPECVGRAIASATPAAKAVIAAATAR